MIIDKRVVFLLIFGGHVSFCGGTDTAVLDFWWRLPWVSKPGWISLVIIHCTFVYYPQAVRVTIRWTSWCRVADRNEESVPGPGGTEPAAPQRTTCSNAATAVPGSPCSKRYCLEQWRVALWSPCWEVGIICYATVTAVPGSPCSRRCCLEQWRVALWSHCWEVGKIC